MSSTSSDVRQPLNESIARIIFMFVQILQFRYKSIELSPNINIETECYFVNLTF